VVGVLYAEVEIITTQETKTGFQIDGSFLLEDDYLL